MDQIKQIKEYADFFKIDKFSLLGGEPLMYPDLDQVLEILPKTSVYTNGKLVGEKIDDLKKAHTVVVSIDGYKDYSESIRGEGTWKIAMDALQILKKEKIKTLLRCSYSSENLEDIKPLVDDLSKPMDIPIIFFPRTDKPPLTTQEQINLYTYILSGQDTDSFIDQPNFFQYIGEPGRCPAGNYRINFCSDGTITPCNMDFSYCLGTIGADPESIKLNIDTYLEFTKVTPYECSLCKNVGVCKGGCVVAKTYTECPLKHNVNFMMISKKQNLDPVAITQRFNNIRDIIRNVVTC
jgi:radical SAM protein with 4Fe4S-binding SPASM domain